MKLARDVEGSVRMVRSPIAPCTLMPSGRAGEVLIKGEVYSLEYLSQFPGDVSGYRLTKPGQTPYDLPADLGYCECNDSIHRSRPNGCKHRRALKALRREGRIA